MTINFNKGILLYACVTEGDSIYVLPPKARHKRITGNDILWVIDTKNDKSYCYTADRYRITENKRGYAVDIPEKCKITEYEGLPDCDFTGRKIHISVDGKSDYQNAFLKFYWFHMLMECAEKTTIQKREDWRDGYVLSTLRTSVYAGTYPAVDHEFHIRGRLAVGGDAELQLVRRMLLLQLRTMLSDKSGDYRIPCSVQPNGKSEYRVMRKSMDKSVTAQMFTVTGIVELCEEMYDYYCITKDVDFIRDNIDTLEKGLEFLLSHIDENGRLSADVYFEDQVIKNGAVAQAQAFAVNSLRCASRLELIVGNENRAEHYLAVSERLRRNYIKDVPEGFWNRENGRYVDWIDNRGVIHDHIHLLSNALSVTYGFNSLGRNDVISAVISDNDCDFQRFPSFVSARIEDYTQDEIGVGGPYDLCAAGRYWCHDAKYRHSISDKATLKNQLDAVIRQAEADGFNMGERYDMNYIYYNKGDAAEKMWHGSPEYYEYPNVFCDVLIHDYFGILPSEEYDLRLSPCLDGDAEICMESIGIDYKINDGVITVENISGDEMTIEIDPSHISADKNRAVITLKPNEKYIPKQEI